MKKENFAVHRSLRAAALSLSLSIPLALFVGASALLLLPLTAVESAAASWQWSGQGQRERLVLQLDAPVQANVRRTGVTTLLLRAPQSGLSALPAVPETFAAQGLLTAVTPVDGGWELHLRNPAFGYLLNKSGPHGFILNIFHDPLGARWTASGNLAPASVAAAYEQKPAPQPSPVAATPLVPVASVPRAAVAAAPVVAPLAQAQAAPMQVSAVDVDDEKLLPELDASASLRPEMQEKSPPSLTGSVLRNFSLSSTAVAAETPTAKTPAPRSINDRGVMVSPQEVHGKINTAGPEGWPSGEYLSTTLAPQGAATGAESRQMVTPRPSPGSSIPATPSASGPATPPVAVPVATPLPPVSVPPALNSVPASPPATTQTADKPVETVVQMRQSAAPAPLTNATAATNSTRPVVYVDEGGNVVPKPADPDALLAEAERLLESTQFKEALTKLEEVKGLSISPVMREKVLYLISDATESLYASDPLKGFEPIVASTSEALNANLRSTRVPDALYRLGMAHLRVGNFTEADAYFKALKRRFPHDINVPVAFVNLGRAQLAKQLHAASAENFRLVLQEYPESNVLRDAAVGLVRSLLRLGDVAQAAVIADFVEKRWARYYLGDAAFLEIMAELSLRMDKKEDALQQYWLFYNLDPSRASNPDVLAIIGDLYLRTERPAAAREVFTEIRKRYPDSTAAAQALLRLAEKGIHDGPITRDEMFRVFENPGTPEPQVAYREVRKAYPDAPRSVLAGLKLALWELWKKQYTDAMGAAADFIDQHPDHPDVERAREVIMQSFLADLKNSLSEENYGRVLILWNGFPLVRERYGPMDPALRNALGRGYLERGEDDRAMELFSEFLKTPKDANYSDTTFALYFNKYLQAGNWNALLDLGETVKNWEMDPKVRGQLDYALALSAENLGLAPKALPLWQQLAANDQIPLYQKAYATYFLAKDAERRKDIRDAYTYNRASLDLFGRLEQERSDKADPERVKEALGSLMDITEVANRIPEALEWVERYNVFVPDTSPEFPGLRFREARLHRKLGDNAKAKSLLELIMQKAPDSPFAKAAESELRTFAVSRDLRNFLPQGQ